MFSPGLLPHVDEFHPGLPRISSDPLVSIELLVVHGSYSAVRHKLEACKTGRGSDVDFGPVDLNAVLRCLGNGICLRVHGSHAVSVLHIVADVVAMRCTTETPVVAGGEDGLIPHDHSADVPSVARASSRDFGGDPHEILIPARAFFDHTDSSHSVVDMVVLARCNLLR